MAGNHQSRNPPDIESGDHANPHPHARQLSQVEWALPTLNVEKIKSQLNIHENFQVKSGYVMSGLPKFDDLSEYDVVEDAEKSLWEREVERLVKMANSPNQARIYGKDEWYGQADREGYIKLHKVAIQVQDALDICIHDNGLLMIRNMRNEANHQQYAQAHKRLQRNFDSGEEKERFQRHLNVGPDNDRYYHALVNFLTGMMLRVLLRTMRGALWEEHSVMAIAKLSAKLKILARNLPQAAARSLERTTDMRYRTQETPTIPLAYSRDEYADPIWDGDDPKLQQQYSGQGKVHAEMRYFILMNTFTSSIAGLLLSALSSLSSNEDTEMSADVFHSDALMYEDYITSRRQYLCSQRDGTIGAAGDPRVIASAGAAFQVCLDAWTSVAETISTRGEPKMNHGSSPEPHGTLLSWKWTTLSRETLSPDPSKPQLSRSLTLNSMRSVITSLVPYSMACGSFPSVLEEMSSSVSLIADPTAPVRSVIQPPFLAAFTMTTNAHILAKQVSIVSDPDACQISDSLVARGKALARAPTFNIVASSSSSSPHSSSSSSSSRPGGGGGRARNRISSSNSFLEHESKEWQLARDRMHSALVQSSAWVIDTSSIQIPNRLYTYSFLSAAALLVAGGLAIGLSVGDRIPGVDPLGLASYTWLSAGFVLLVAKSLRVENWPWSRFFRGQVVCRSVSEVRAVTGMDEQLILAILLRLEPRMSLVKRGPFNAVFEKRTAEGVADEGGFAVDVPFRETTLIEGGLILVKVQSVIGDAVVGIKSDLWTRYESVSPKGENIKGERVVCRDFSDPGVWGGERLPLYALSRGDVQWFRTVGLLNVDGYFG